VVATLSKVERRFMKEKDARKILAEFLEHVHVNDQQLASLKPPVEVSGTKHEELFFVGGVLVFAKSGNMLFPTLTSTRILSALPKATVNMGAVPYVCNGADVMAPGIVGFEGDFDKDDFVVVIDERHRKPIAMTAALFNTKEAKKLERGKVLKNMHYVGDNIWNLTKQLSQSK
jgi:PUA-domain protein